MKHITGCLGSDVERVSGCLWRHCVQGTGQSSGAVWKSRWTSWATVPNKPTVSVDVKQHFNQTGKGVWTGRDDDDEVELHVLGCRLTSDILVTNCDQWRSTVQCCFTSIETVRLIRTESPVLTATSTLTQLLSSAGVRRCPLILQIWGSLKAGGVENTQTPHECCKLIKMTMGTPKSKWKKNSHDMWPWCMVHFALITQYQVKTR